MMGYVVCGLGWIFGLVIFILFLYCATRLGSRFDQYYEWLKILEDLEGYDDQGN